MQTVALICLFVVGAYANGYGAPAVVRVESSGYNAVQDVPSYSSGYGATVVRNNIPIVRLNQEIRGGLSDNTEYETGNGIRVSESTQAVAGRGGSYDDGYGQMVQSDSTLVKSGSFSYTADDGTPIALSWTADENGFRATGAHLPTPPPMPAEIAASLRGSSYGSYGSPAVVVRAENSYAAPAVVVRAENSYAAPAVVVRAENSYAAPALVRSSYAPATLIRSSGY